MCIFAILAAVVFAQPLLGQMPPPAPKPIVRPIPSTLAAKAGKLVSIPVDGDFDVVSFVYSHKDFPPDQAIIAPRQLTLVTGTNGIYSVTVVTVKDKADKQSLVTITITGGVDPGPTPPPPEPDQSIATLTAAVKSLTVVVSKQGTDNAVQFSAIWDALKGPRPPPIPPVPPTPIPPVPVAASVWVMAVYDSATIPSVPGLQGILTDDALWASVRSKGNDWQKLTSQDVRYTTTYRPILDNAKVSLPALIILSKTGAATEKVLQVVPMPADSAAVSKLITAITGK